MAGLSLAMPLKELRAGRNRLSVSYCDETAFQMYSHELTAGRLPEKETEIAVSSILIRMEGSEDMGMEELRQYILTCLEPYGFDDSDIAFSFSYFTTFDNASGNMLLTAAISVLILIACAAVIYSLFYISVTGKVKEYGRLRVIGMTRKQMKRLVRKESRKPSFFSIPLGIISGGHRWIPAYPRRLALAKYSQVCSRYSPCYGNNSYAVHTKTCTDCSISIPCGGGQDYNNNGCKETG